MHPCIYTYRVTETLDIDEIIKECGITKEDRYDAVRQKVNTCASLKRKMRQAFQDIDFVSELIFDILERVRS